MSQPTLYLMFGFPGAGKTTTAKIIEELTGAVRLSSDEVRVELFPEPLFSDEEHIALYAELNKRTEELLQSGKSVIYDANLNRYEHRAEKYTICHQTGAKAQLIWLHTERELAKSRAVQDSRSHLWPRSEQPETMFDRIADVVEPPTDSEHPIELDGTKIDSAYVADKLSITA